MKIVTDTSTLYSPAEGQEIGIDVLPLQVMVNNKSYREFEEVSSAEFLEMVKAGGIPSSSQPAIGETMEVFEKYPDEEILVINMADGLSGTYQSTLSAKEGMDNSERIHVINTMTLCGPQRYLVERAIQLKNEGKTLEEIKQELYKLIATEISFLVPQDFEFLKRGGRLTPLAATIGGMLKITPIMSKTKDGKRLEKYGMKKSTKGAIKEILKAFQEHGVDDTYTIYITHAGAEEEAEIVKQQSLTLFPNTELKVYPLSPAFITQGGPGCFAVQAIKK